MADKVKRKTLGQATDAEMQVGVWQSFSDHKPFCDRCGKTPDEITLTWDDADRSVGPDWICRNCKAALTSAVVCIAFFVAGGIR